MPCTVEKILQNISTVIRHHRAESCLVPDEFNTGLAESVLHGVLNLKLRTVFLDLLMDFGVDRASRV